MARVLHGGLIFCLAFLAILRSSIQDIARYLRRELGKRSDCRVGLHRPNLIVACCALVAFMVGSPMMIVANGNDTDFIGIARSLTRYGQARTLLISLRSSAVIGEVASTQLLSILVA